jgi:hypothetical protein
VADDIRVEVDDRAVRELFSDWNGPVGQAVEQVTQIVEDNARILAPISPIGSLFAPRGFLKIRTRTSEEHHYDADGHVIGLVGAPRYPYNFIANPTSHKGYTVNPRSAKHPGRVTTRRATDNYLEDAINSAPHIIIGEP